MSLGLSIIFTVLIYAVVMGLPFIKPFALNLDYEKNMLSVLGWYTIGIAAVFFATQLSDILIWQSVYAFLFALISGPVLLFASWWQKNGRPYMPQTKLSGTVTTFYEFSRQYAVVKILEIMFQNICAANVIFTLYVLTESVLWSGVYFALIFITLHSFSVYYLGKAWFIFIGAAFFLVLAITPFVIMFEYGFGILFLIHVSCYILFLLYMQRRLKKAFM